MKLEILVQFKRLLYLILIKEPMEICLMIKLILTYWTGFYSVRRNSNSSCTVLLAGFIACCSCIKLPAIMCSIVNLTSDSKNSFTTSISGIYSYYFDFCVHKILIPCCSLYFTYFLSYVWFRLGTMLLRMRQVTVTWIVHNIC